MAITTEKENIIHDAVVAGLMFLIYFFIEVCAVVELIAAIRSEHDALTLIFIIILEVSVISMDGMYDMFLQIRSDVKEYRDCMRRESISRLDTPCKHKPQ